MPYCPKCGSEVNEKMAFCPKCGATLNATATTQKERYRNEKDEKDEKYEKHEKDEGEKAEKYEKQEYSVFGSLIGGCILILLGVMFYLAVTGALHLRSMFPVFLIIVGAIVIIGVLVGAVKARENNPRP
jgi:uncharacterized membrane protein YvbJ